MRISTSIGASSHAPNARRLALAVAIAFALVLRFPTAVPAYSGSAAATYADANYNQHPTSGATGCGVEMGECYVSITHNCANFVSAALHESGYDFHGTGTAAATIVDKRKWFSRWSSLYGTVHTVSWAYAHGLYEFLMLDEPGGTLIGTHPGSKSGGASGGVKGSVIFYDWDQISEQRPIDHVAIQVAYGADTTNASFYGSLVDQQDPDRRHVIWTRRPANFQWSTTKIYVVNVSSSN